MIKYNYYKLSKSKIKILSNRNFGIGFDQVILIGPPTKDSFDFSIRFFNADGGEASMCLNGIRCAASYVWRNNFAPKKSIIFKKNCNFAWEGWSKLKIDYFLQKT